MLLGGLGLVRAAAPARRAPVEPGRRPPVP
jgi:hypothetical protein